MNAPYPAPDRPSPATADAPQHRIASAARRSGVSPANIRYYEKEGLLPPGVRGDNGYRSYGDEDIHRLRFIRLCRAMDMSLAEVRTLMALDWTRKADCDAARTALDAHLEHVRSRLAELQALERDLLALRNRCDGSDTHCHLIEALHQQADAVPRADTDQAASDAPGARAVPSAGGPADRSSVGAGARRHV